jgi:predicted flap endonuclease-1-like 5' DNA nuclease
MIKVETIEGIGPVYAAKLGEIGILTTEDLLTAGATRKGRQELVEKTGVSDKLVLRWVNIADLMRVPGIGEEYSELLEAAGVDTVKELRNRNPNNLYNALIVANNEKNLVRRVPHLTEVQSWVQAAKELEPRMRY